jgi:rhamnulokinase
MEKAGAKSPVLVAIDLGAESCRVSLLRWFDGSPVVQLIHRFPNAPVADGSSLRWDVEAIVSGLEHGLRLCAEVASGPIAAIGVDGWAVDYARLGPDGNPIAQLFCYRDERTVEAECAVHQVIPPDRLYELTGIQLLRLNTLYQLYADGKSGISPDVPWVNLPEYITYRLGGTRVAEYTNATHTGLVSLGKHEWCRDIFAATGLDIVAAPPIVSTGTTVGRLQRPLAELPAFRDTRLIVPATHDTASAVAGIPAEGDNWAFISSGTWSLVGTLLDKPCVTALARQKNFTNLGGAGGKICFLKNVNGMWLLRQCLDHWDSLGYRGTIDALVRVCAELPAPDFLLDVDDPDLLLPGDMPGKINAQRRRAGYRPLPADCDAIPAVANTIFHSLAARYAGVLQDIKAITGKSIDRLYVVGGGSRNALLNRLTSGRTGLELRTGAPESATIGNFAIQMAALDGDFDPCIGVTHAAVAKRAGVLTGS